MVEQLKSIFGGLFGKKDKENKPLDNGRKAASFDGSQENDSAVKNTYELMFPKKNDAEGKRRYTLGRVNKEAMPDLPVTDSSNQHVSETHAWLYILHTSEGTKLYIKDAASTNGTIVSDGRMHRPIGEKHVELLGGEYIIFGDAGSDCIYRVDILNEQEDGYPVILDRHSRTHAVISANARSRKWS